MKVLGIFLIQSCANYRALRVFGSITILVTRDYQHWQLNLINSFVKASNKVDYQKSYLWGIVWEDCWDAIGSPSTDRNLRRTTPTKIFSQQPIYRFAVS